MSGFDDPRFGYVILSVAGSWIVNFLLAGNVAAGRKKYGVKYPNLYADPSTKYAFEFNCIQRSHQNTLESWAPVQILAILNGIYSPMYAAAFNGLWCLGRIAYGIGYSLYGPQARMVG